MLYHFLPLAETYTRSVEIFHADKKASEKYTFFYRTRTKVRIIFRLLSEIYVLEIIIDDGYFSELYANIRGGAKCC